MTSAISLARRSNLVVGRGEHGGTLRVGLDDDAGKRLRVGLEVMAQQRHRLPHALKLRGCHLEGSKFSLSIAKLVDLDAQPGMRDRDQGRQAVHVIG